MSRLILNSNKFLINFTKEILLLHESTIHSEKAEINKSIANAYSLLAAVINQVLYWVVNI
jgi:hypothetical protein